MRTWVGCILILWFGLVWGDSGSSLWHPSSEQLQQLRASVQARQARLFDHGSLRPRMTSIDAVSLALDAVAVDYDPNAVTEMLSALPPLLDNDPASKTFGNIRWYQGDSTVVDRNGIEFVTRQAALLWLLYEDRLSPAQRAPLRRLLDAARSGIPRHQVAISYTNIYLMKAWNLIALGEGLHDDVLAKQGYSMLADWLAYTRRTGVNEFLSPTYYEVDFECLALIHNLSQNPQARDLARQGLDWLWQDVAMNWYALAGRLGGNHSRDYDRLFSRGGVNQWVARAGWQGNATAWQARSPYEAYAWAPPPPDAGSWLQGPFPRIVAARWGEAPEKRYVHYMDRGFDIASTDAGYSAGHDNAPLVINLGASEDVPIINFFMDGRHDYYGQNKTLEAGSGHMKALHLRPFLTSVQHDNEVLFVASVRDGRSELSALESVLTLPADAEYWLDNRRLDVFATSSRWVSEPGPNGTTTKLDVKSMGGRPELWLADHDEKQGVGVAQVFAVQAGQLYRLSASLQGGDVFLYLNFLDANKHLIGGEHAHRVSGGSDFVVRDYAQLAPAGAVWCRAWLYSTTANRTDLRVADLRFERITAGGRVQLLGGFDFKEYVPQRFEVPPGATLFVRREGAAAALRLLGAWDVQGHPVGFQMFNDGLAYHAMRLTATHSAEHTDARASLTMWAMATGGLTRDEDFAAFRQRVIGFKGNVQLSANRLDVYMEGEHPLHLIADIEAGVRIVREGANGLPDDQARWVDSPRR